MASSIPGAVHNFLTLMTAVMPSDSTVEFALVRPKFEAPLTLRVYGVAGTQMSAELGPSYRREESYSLLVELTSWEGDQDYLTRMDEVFAAWSTVTTAIANDPQLTGVPNGNGTQGVVRFAQPENMNYTPRSDVEGMSLGCLTFEVHCEARIASLS